MARATSKKDLQDYGEKEFEKLLKLLDSLSVDDLNKEFSFDLEKEKGAHWALDKNVRDVLVHLHEWHKLLLDWVSSNLAGDSKQFLKEGYNWRTYGLMNQEFVDNNQTTTYEEALSNLKESHNQVMILIEDFSNENLFEKGVYSWTNASTLGSYFASASSSHYEWAIKKIRKFIKLNNI